MQEVLHLSNLSKPVTVEILEYLKMNPNSPVMAVYKDLDIEQSICSINLKRLYNANMVSKIRDGQKVKYSLNLYGIADLFDSNT